MFPDRRSPRQMGMGVSPGQQRRRGRYPGQRMAEPRGRMRNGQFRTSRLEGNSAPTTRTGLFGGRNKKGSAIPSQDVAKPKSSFMQQLKKDDGQWDLDKIMTVSSHMQKMYGQVSPLLTRFISK